MALPCLYPRLGEDILAYHGDLPLPTSASFTGFVDTYRFRPSLGTANPQITRAVAVCACVSVNEVFFFSFLPAKDTHYVCNGSFVTE